MIRVLFALISLLLVVFLFLRIEKQPPAAELPVFLRVDQLVQEHSTNTQVSVHSREQPNAAQLESVTKDYNAIWAHLNHLYATNDVVAGKEYYTEDWFRQICLHYKEIKQVRMSRNDIEHNLHIVNWSKDGLVCAAIDSNAVMEYGYPDRTLRYTTMNLALVLLYQGDHWRIDALRVLNEKEIDNPKLQTP